MKKIYILTILLIPLCIYIYLIRYDIYSIYKLHNCIVWNDNTEVVINDFEMQPDLKSSINLNFWHGISLTPSGFGDANAVAFFDKSKSWTKDTTKYDYKMEMKLQKLSFDLNEVYARKINNKIKAVKYANYGNEVPYEKLEKECFIIYKKYEKENYEMLNEKEKSIHEIITYWRPIVDNML